MLASSLSPVSRGSDARHRASRRRPPRPNDSGYVVILTLRHRYASSSARHPGVSVLVRGLPPLTDQVLISHRDSCRIMPGEHCDRETDPVFPATVTARTASLE